MAIKIPDGADVLRDHQLTAIRILSVMTAQGGWLDKAKSMVKSRMGKRNVVYAESPVAIAQLRSSGHPRQFVDPVKLYELVKADRISLAEFLGVICVRTSLLPPLLSGNEIAAISQTPAEDDAPAGDGSLYVEWKPDARPPNVDAIAHVLECSTLKECKAA